MESKSRTALLFGIFTNKSDKFNQDYFCLTENAKLFDLNLKGALVKTLIIDGPFSEEKRLKLFNFPDPTIHHYVKDYDRVAIVHLGPLNTPEGMEKFDMKIENIISGIVFALRYLKNYHFDSIYVDPCGHPKIVGTAVSLITPILNTKYSTEDNMFMKYFDNFHLGGKAEYDKGLWLGKGQIVAQQLMKSPSIKDFIKFAKSIMAEFDLNFTERNTSWMSEKKMSSLLSVCRNSVDQPVILEVTYNNADHISKPLIIVGKSTPYESSPFPLHNKPELHQFQYRSGMGGASCIIGALYALCKMEAPVHVHCILAIVWNSLKSKSIKQGEIVQAMNGIKIQVDGPEAEGRLIMADVLSYADTMESTGVLDVTSLSSNIDGLLGNSYIAFFTSDEYLKQVLIKASKSSGEKVWQLPFFQHFRHLLDTSKDADISNTGHDIKSVTACKSATFLRVFVRERKSWIHLDISAVCECKGKRNYLFDWATGRSTRLVAEFCVEYFQKYHS